MKSLKNFIHEGFKLGKNKVSEPTENKYFPKDKNQLSEILKKRLAEDENANLNNIDTSNITNMSYLFKYLDPHNIDISEWDVSNVEDMNGMFYECKNFNCDLSDWDVSNVIDMKWMLGGCDSLKNKPSWYKEYNE